MSAPASRAVASRATAVLDRRGFNGLPPVVLVPMMVLGVGLAIGTGFFWMLWWILGLSCFRFQRHGLGCSYDYRPTER